MWGLTSDQWNAIAALAQIAGAAATFAAVVVALRLGRRQTSEQLSVRTGKLFVLTIPEGAERTTELEEVFATVVVANVGMVPVHVAGMFWRESRRGREVDVPVTYKTRGADEIIDAGASVEYGYRMNDRGELVERTARAPYSYVPLLKPAFVRVLTKRGESFIAPFPPPWRPKWYRALRHVPPPDKFELRRRDAGGGMTITHPDRLPASVSASLPDPAAAS